MLHFLRIGAEHRTMFGFLLIVLLLRSMLKKCIISLLSLAMFDFFSIAPQSATLPPFTSSALGFADLGAELASPVRSHVCVRVLAPVCVCERYARLPPRQLRTTLCPRMCARTHVRICVRMHVRIEENFSDFFEKKFFCFSCVALAKR